MHRRAPHRTDRPTPTPPPTRPTPSGFLGRSVLPGLRAVLPGLRAVAVAALPCLACSGCQFLQNEFFMFDRAAPAPEATVDDGLERP